MLPKTEFLRTVIKMRPYPHLEIFYFYKKETPKKEKKEKTRETKNYKRIIYSLCQIVLVV